MKFNRHEILFKHYAQQIASEWKWDAIKRMAEKHKELSENGAAMIGRTYLGTVFSIMPSGKYYMPWTTNQTRTDETKDSAYMEALEEAAEKVGGWIENGEGDACDMFFAMSFDLENEEKE